MTHRVHTSYADLIATVTLTRPDKRNALDIKMIEAIVDAGEALMKRGDVRAVVLCGSGASFCAGLDTSVFGALIEATQQAGGIEARTHGDSNLFQRATMVWRDLPMPVIAAVHGHIYGGGFQIMLGADIRIATPDAKLSIREANWGIIPDMGGMALMPALAQSDVIRKLTYTAEVFTGKMAQGFGFVTEISADPVARAQELACQIATKNPDATRISKRLFAEIEHRSSKDILEMESAAQAKLIGTPNQMEAVMAGLEKRPARFKDPR
jgi:enoyl-CoA hydratase/carnithine racemase